MPYPLFKSSSIPRPVISRPLPLRSYQDDWPLDMSGFNPSGWSFSETDEATDEPHAYPDFQHPQYFPAIPERSPLRPRLNRPNPPPALSNSLRSTSFYYEGDELDYYLNHSPTSPETSTISATSSSSDLRSSSSTQASTPPCPDSTPSHQTTFLIPTTPPLPNVHSPQSTAISSRYLTAKHKKYLASKLSQCQSHTSEQYYSHADLSPLLPPSFRTRCESDSVFEYADYLHQSSRVLPPEDSLTLCSESGWRCVAKRSPRMV